MHLLVRRPIKGILTSVKTLIKMVSVCRKELMTVYVFVVNPVAGSGRSLKILPQLIEVLKRRGIEWQVYETTAPGDATALATSAIQGGNVQGVIAVGGDGTMREVASGLKGSAIPLLFASCGTGNDFIKSTKLPKDPLQALERQLDAPIGSIDIGRVNEHFFLNVSGTGLDVEVLARTEKYKQNASGMRPYLMGVVSAIRDYRPTEAQISFDGELLRDARFSILSLGNGRFFGGGMKPVPDALLNDGYFDVVLVRPVYKWSIPILMALFIPGLHAKTPLAKRSRVRRLYIKCKGMTLNLDGELIRCDEAEYEILPGALTVRLPGIASS